jgi:peptide deformylase
LEGIVQLAIRNIVCDGDETLRKSCREVTDFDDRTRTILDDMIDTMRESGGAGIAAPQVGILRKMFVIEPEEGEITEFINPVVIEKKGSQTSDEGCLSVPGLVGTTNRPEFIKVEAQDRNGAKVIHEAEGFKAVVICHELDHLEGVLYTDIAKDIREASDEESDDANDE